jgi:hydrogenase maturation protease
MNQTLVDTLVHAVIYKHDILDRYPASAKKNSRCFTFGRVYPEAYSRAQLGVEPCSMQTECLVEGFCSATLEIIVRFLHPIRRDVGELSVPMREMPAADNPDFFHVVPELVVDGEAHASWQEAVERAVPVPEFTLGDLLDEVREIPFSFPARRTIGPIRDHAGLIAGVIVREQDAVSGSLELSAEPVDAAVTKVSVRIVNQTPEPRDGFDDPDELVMRTFASTHTLLHVKNGAFLSMIDPPDAYAQAAALCRNLGTWPVLVGDEAARERDTLVSSPIILYDYPTLASESPGDLFDAGEIDEIPTSRIRTLPGADRLERRGAGRHTPGRETAARTTAAVE